MRKEEGEKEGGGEGGRLGLHTPSSDDITDVATKRIVVMVMVWLVVVWSGGGACWLYLLYARE